MWRRSAGDFDVRRSAGCACEHEATHTAHSPVVGPGTYIHIPMHPIPEQTHNQTRREPRAGKHQQNKLKKRPRQESNHKEKTHTRGKKGRRKRKTRLAEKLERADDVPLVVRARLEHVEHRGAGLDVGLGNLIGGGERGRHVQVDAVVDGEGGEGLSGADLLRRRE